ncbi:MAG: GlxA family transcriptional regulator [Geminicoccaceae bacterium]
MMQDASTEAEESRRAGDRVAPCFVFFLQPEFPINALILASEALRIANQNSGSTLFTWHYASMDGAPVRASNGMWMEVDYSLGGLPPADYLFLFEGNLPTQKNAPRLLARLRAVVRYGAVIAAIDTAAFAFAQSGLARGRKVVLHWEAVPTFQERFPDIMIKDALYEVDDAAIFCGGGVATLDLMLELIGRLHDEALANEVANALVHTRRPADRPQRLDGKTAPGEPSLSAGIIDLMERHPDFPLSPADLAGRLDISIRSLERHCRRHFRKTPMQLYLLIRLQAARNFLFYEDMSLKDISIACGFSYPSVFSRAFRDHFGQTPSDFRRTIRNQQDQSLRPEIRRLALKPPIPRATGSKPVDRARD